MMKLKSVSLVSVKNNNRIFNPTILQSDRFREMVNLLL